jgi:hypothetical protein
MLSHQRVRKRNRRKGEVVLTESYWPADHSERVLESTVGGVLREAAGRPMEATEPIDSPRQIGA